MHAPRDTREQRVGEGTTVSEYSRGACSARVAVRVEEYAVDDVDDAVREEHVGLRDQRGDVARRDV